MLGGYFILPHPVDWYVVDRALELVVKCILDIVIGVLGGSIL